MCAFSLLVCYITLNKRLIKQKAKKQEEAEDVLCLVTWTPGFSLELVLKQQRRQHMRVPSGGSRCPG